MRRLFSLLRLASLYGLLGYFAFVVTFAYASNDTEISPGFGSESQTYTSFSIAGTPKYRGAFRHFEYVCPTAPKGGTLRLGIVGSYDSFNPFAQRGIAETRSWQLYETLFTMSEDENASYYPLLALTIQFPPTSTWAIVTLNPLAKFHDGTPITADDVVFSFAKFSSEGPPHYQTLLTGMTLTALSKHRIKIILDKPDREKLAGLLSSLSILPKHFWHTHSLNEPLTTPPIGSGPYRVSEYKMGEYALYDRLVDYWGKDLPVNHGQHNFDHIRQDYYLDDDIAFEAFKAGEYDVRHENRSRRWHKEYPRLTLERHKILKESRVITSPPNTHWLAFNLEKSQWEDRRVRHAITLAFDFDWINRNYYNDSYQSANSFFTNTPYAATQIPSPEEQALLFPYRHSLPSEIFHQPFQLSQTDFSGFNRSRLQQAHDLLSSAGWIYQDQNRRHYKTGDSLHFELLIRSTDAMDYILPFQQNLKHLGIAMTVKRVEPTHFAVLRQQRQYDMIPIIYYAYPYPSSTLHNLWGSHSLHSSWNSSKLNTDVINDLLKRISDQQHDPAQLLLLGRALDRALMYHYAMIPMGYPKYTYLAYRDTIGMPKKHSKYTLGSSSWWYNR